MRMRNIVVGLCTVPALVLLHVRVARAEPPSNDDRALATVVPSVPFTDQVDTSEATVEEGEPECTIETGGSVWYSFTPDADIRVQMDTIGSDYDLALCVFDSKSGNLVRSDDPDGPEARVLFNAVANETYLAVVAGSAFQSGNLIFHVIVGPPEMVHTSLDGAVVDSKTGVATLDFTTSCLEPMQIAVFGTLRQSIGRFEASGDFFIERSCDEAEEQWSVAILPQVNFFKGGKATLEAESCPGLGGDQDCIPLVEVVTLKPDKKAN